MRKKGQSIITDSFALLYGSLEQDKKLKIREIANSLLALSLKNETIDSILATVIIELAKSAGSSTVEVEQDLEAESNEVSKTRPLFSEPEKKKSIKDIKQKRKKKNFSN